MNEEELKALVGDKAFEAMTKEQRDGAIAKYVAASKPKEPEKKDPPKEKEGKEGKEGDDPDLLERVKKEKEAADKSKSDLKAVEKALKFNMGVASFVKDNLDALPADFADLLKAADKESYDTAAEKASAVKSVFIQSFFSVQANADLLTANQKVQLDDYLKLTKKGKEDKAETIYENIFEPAFETFKKVKKAEELGKARSGFSSGSKVEDGYKARLMASSRKTYLNEKEKGT